MDYHIKTLDVGKVYKQFFKQGHCALKSLSIEVPAGSVMGFLGPNGAGKTTTIKLLLGLITPSYGSIEIRGFDLSDPRSRESVAYMPELPALDKRDTALSFLNLIGEISKMEKIFLKTRIEEVLSEVGLTGKEEQLFSAYSKGMIQRIQLAQALLSKPELLILDEPFSGLDPIARLEVRDLIMRYNKEFGTTVFFSSHILSDVEVLCDSIGIINKGELCVVGNKEDVLGVEFVEISGRNVSRPGMMFLEKMCSHSTLHDDCFSIFILPDKDIERFKKLFKKYGALDINVETHCRNLEDFFMETIKE
jgi:ABC-2 type transport system ATP-binding protein